ncbi:unnamed protein product [Ectocarpus sp. CCAP 1310/34]|nr:unnamed protein product [Ectocarpus sp. CCAP 1310/34]
MSMSAAFAGFAKRYSAKYIQTGSFSPVLHFMGVSALTHLSIKYVVVGQHKSAQKKEEAKKIRDFYNAHHVGAHH